ncbi:hypothetical protein [Actinoplanes couchii]|uniref:Uncharacterized protein n=1 Tax=Actinoplanes couchii TaxID=403638 RepID=A0ABQ3XQJ8_9ACTN|nr:hypothetical protein [Actinoplanes couchii]MDR6317470.1 hypothetical protein [Actinoplanes couchii]GID60771.1 hypothetical protein Aco03nite_091750 [Actinoplanes couchii]
MSAFGPALFVSRIDRAVIREPEQAVIIALIRTAASASQARIYDYDECEPEALGVLLHSDYGYQHLPDDARQELDDAWEAEGHRVAAVVERRRPGVYEYRTYPVED